MRGNRGWPDQGQDHHQLSDGCQISRTT